MSERVAGKKFTGLLSCPALARHVDLSATSLSFEGREGSRTAGQDGQNGREGLLAYFLVRPILPVRRFSTPPTPKKFLLRMKATTPKMQSLRH